jgi:hypothetical protein
MTAGRRWDIDEVGHGVADGSRVLPELDRLRAALALPDWIAEQPEAHLLPHLMAAAERLGLTVTDTSLEPDLLTVVLAGPGGSHGDIRAAAFSLLASVAELATSVRERQAGNETAFEIATGMLEGDSGFAAHGHLLRLVFRR